MFYRTGVIADCKFYIAGIGILDLFCSCDLDLDLDLDPMFIIYELDQYSLEIYQVCKNELPKSTLSKHTYIETDRQTDRQTWVIKRISR